MIYQLIERVWGDRKQRLAETWARYWRDGSNQTEVVPELRDPEHSQPFVVRLRGKGWIPVNHIVWGADEEEAKARLLLALEVCHKGEFQREKDKYGDERRAHVDTIWQKYQAGEMAIEVEALDTMGMYHVQFGSNAF